MIFLQDILDIHELVLNQSGGGSGVRDIDTLTSAISRPFQTFDGTELYPSAVEKAAALLESIIMNHPFVDGNKRTGFTVANIYLMKHGLEIEGDDDAIYDVVIAIASGKMNYDAILHWLKNNIQKL